VASAAHQLWYFIQRPRYFLPPLPKSDPTLHNQITCQHFGCLSFSNWSATMSCDMLIIASAPRLTSASVSLVNLYPILMAILPATLFAVTLH
jgi:hypothetical protein